MTITSIGGKPAAAIQSLVNLRNTLDDLQRQLSTGQKSTTYAGLGLNRGVTVSLNAQLSAMTGFDQTADIVNARIGVASTALSQMSDLAASVKTSMSQGSYSSTIEGINTAQAAAGQSFDQMLSLLNSRAGDRYLFSGKATDQPAVETYDHIMNGNGTQAGLKQIISERNQADLGANGLGRLNITAPTSTSLSVAEDAVSPFGFKLASINSTLANGTVTGPTGSPPSMTVDLSGGNPTDGNTVTMRFNLPDGTSENLTLTATTSSPPGANQFTIGPDAATTAANLQTALTTSVTKLAATSLTAASASQASTEFFNADANHPPVRVDGPPFDSATATKTGSSADTVIWYTGDADSGNARATASAQVDTSLSVNYGMRANETALRSVIQSTATLAAVTISASNTNATDLSLALNQRLTDKMNGAPGDQMISTIQTDLSNAQVTISAAKTRHQQQTSTANDLLQQITGVSNEEVGAEILTLQTRLQASMQVTSMMYQTSLVNYIK
ncbi:MAG: flagellar biosynthesis protein FlgL [Rhodopseudomonas sp.]|nr:flagellar biosynthesis protein FlgL [Rhodopseudomonas sp.]